jgi:hypothetical protein
MTIWLQRDTAGRGSGTASTNARALSQAARLRGVSPQQHLAANSSFKPKDSNAVGYSVVITDQPDSAGSE